jgi:hypothetical protein
MEFPNVTNTPGQNYFIDKKAGSFIDLDFPQSPIPLNSDLLIAHHFL